MRKTAFIVLIVIELFQALEFLEERASRQLENQDSQSRNLNSAFSCNTGSCQSNHWSLCDCIRPRREANENKSTKQKNPDFGNISVLEDLEVDCKEHFVTEFTLRYEDVSKKDSRDVSNDEVKNKNSPDEWFGDFKIWIDYKCTDEKAEKKSTTKHETDWKELPSLTNIVNLDSHKVLCPDKKALVSFKLDYDKKKGTRYKYECGDHYNFNSNNSGKYFELSDKFWAQGAGTSALRNIRVASFGDNYLSGFEMIKEVINIETTPCCLSGIITCLNYCNYKSNQAFDVWRFKAYYCN